jgi:hypothetical protein
MATIIWFNMATTMLFCLSILMLNIGGRYLFLDFQDPVYQMILSHPSMRLVYVFCIGFIGSRNLILSTIVAAMYFVVVRLALPGIRSVHAFIYKKT